MLAWWVVDQWVAEVPATVRIGLLVAAIAMMISHGWFNILAAARTPVSRSYAAWSIEQQHPALGHSLSSFVALDRDEEAGEGPPRLNQRMVQTLAAALAPRLRRVDPMPAEAAGLNRWWVALVAMLAMLAIYAVATPKSPIASTRRLLTPTATLPPPAA